MRAAPRIQEAILPRTVPSLKNVRTSDCFFTRSGFTLNRHSACRRVRPAHPRVRL
jgi:hypothetical protein